MKRILILIWGVGLSTAALASAPPSAVVEAISNAPGAKVAQLDFVSPGTTIRLGAHGRLQLGYLDSCAHETISGGTVVVGIRKSRVSGGSRLHRTKTACDSGKLALAADEATQSGAIALRGLAFANPDPEFTVHHRQPVIILPRAGEVIVQRLDGHGDRHLLKSRTAPNGRTYVDLAADSVELQPGTAYEVLVHGRANAFRVAKDAGSGAAPVLSRLVPF